MGSVNPTEIDLATLAWLTGSAANRYLLASLRSRGHPDVRISHGYVIQHLIDREPTISELARRMQVTQQRASTQIRELEQLGYVTRHPDDTDSRARRVRLTTRGTELVADSRRVRESLNVELIGRVGEEHAEVATTTLARLLDLVGGESHVRRRSAPLPED
ncbi:MarR family winged helix-turn-helix transcriptional regulator [Microbacterium suaedae]|uniref:MarR family winged helix-turn-helix transcriptional regulator n=1 Tax=Microbacterium suaedae TaxID=2067813 RepID=UPI000DA1FD55|nr:MarR family transcriptional regulator [Microbacterium suaedae]